MSRKKVPLHNPGCAQYAENCGAPGIRVSKKKDPDQDIQQVAGPAGPAPVEMRTDVEPI